MMSRFSAVGDHAFPVSAARLCTEWFTTALHRHHHCLSFTVASRRTSLGAAFHVCSLFLCLRTEIVTVCQVNRSYYPLTLLLKLLTYLFTYLVTIKDETISLLSESLCFMHELSMGVHEKRLAI